MTRQEAASEIDEEPTTSVIIEALHGDRLPGLKPLVAAPPA
jgi:hypothetical protein